MVPALLIGKGVVTARAAPAGENALGWRRAFASLHAALEMATGARPRRWLHGEWDFETVAAAGLMAAAPREEIGEAVVGDGEEMDMEAVGRRRRTRRRWVGWGGGDAAAVSGVGRTRQRWPTARGSGVASQGEI